MKKQAIFTANAPEVVGCYSQGIRVGNSIYLAMEKGFFPETMKLVEGFEGQLNQIFKNLGEIAKEGGSDLNSIVKLIIYVIDIKNSPKVNTVMNKYFVEPYPARGVIEVSRLPGDALVAVDAIINCDK